MKKFVSRSFFIRCFAIVLILFSCLQLQAQKPNFNGDWKLDEAKSELGDFAGRTVTAVKAEQKDADITITSTRPGFGGGDPITSTLVLPYDGKVVESTGFANSKRKTTAKWSDDGKTLIINNTINFERDGQAFEFKSTENWTMTADGLLSIVTNASSAMGESTTKAIYKK